MKKYTVNDVIIAVNENSSIAGVLRHLGLRPVGGNYKTINKIIREQNIDISHFTGQGWNVGLKFRPKPEVTDESIFVDNSTYTCSWRLRERYKKLTGLSSCQCCGLSEWLGKPISLEIHHKNGNNHDNRIENLVLLCPNCHAQTEHYRGRARKNKSEQH